MDWKIELIHVPVSDVDRAKDFYVNKLGFNADHDQRCSDELRFVQLTPPGSACSIAIGEGLGGTLEPGTLDVIQVVIPDADAVLAELRAKGVEAEGVDEQEWGRFVTLQDPDGNRWTLQELPDYSAGQRAGDERMPRGGVDPAPQRVGAAVLPRTTSSGTRDVRSGASGSSRSTSSTVAMTSWPSASKSWRTVVRAGVK